MKRFDEVVENWEGEHYAAEHFEGDGWEESAKSIYERTHEITETVKRTIERVELLGPENVDAAAVRLLSALAALREAVRAKAGSTEWPDWDAHHEARKATGEARRDFLRTSRETTRVAPRP
ncbi:hypothetical protein [Streptomyces sp. NPDC047009]|uniref:hypothetical protein n=1 Tax=unclassified Streptomyces TaxID=2593676 RepID=UPI0033DEF6CD